jgi:acyl-CoA hydrolase
VSEPKPAAQSESILVRWMGLGDANAAGFVHGGVVMRLCDEAAGIAAIRHCGLRIVTAAVDRMTFTSPIHIAELVSCRAKVNAAWRTSMEVGVRVEAENPRSGEVRHTSTAYLTMVALDENGRPTPVPALAAESEDEVRRQREAELRRSNRLAERDEILGGRQKS